MAERKKLKMVDSMPSLSGTVTFLFTDIEGSSRLWEQEPVRMSFALARHDAIARAAVEAHRSEVDYNRSSFCISASAIKE